MAGSVMRQATPLVAALLLAGAAAQATETENNLVRVLPTPAKVTIDGAVDDWNLAAGIFAVSDVENLRDQYGVWFHAMYDAANLYLLARWNDPVPLNNPGSSKGDMGFQGDCLQMRFITHLEGRDGVAERVTHWTGWQDRDRLDVLDVAYGRTFKDGGLRDAQEHGAAQAFRVADDGKHYVQEIAIPWALLTADGQPLKSGAELRMALEPNYTAGAGGRVSIKDIFQPNIVPDRVFTFRAYTQWGTARLEKPAAAVEPQPLRLADRREFAVRIENGAPVVDWTGLIASREPPGFKPVAFDMPLDGYISLNLYDGANRVVRQLLNAAFYTKGRHEVRWDGLTTPHWRTPGTPVPAGDYTWRALVHPGIGLRLRGWAANGGSAPWDSGPSSNWGGDHGVPVACAADGDKVYLGWSGSEAGKALVACDLQGRVQWKHTHGGMGGAEQVAVDAGTVTVCSHGDTLYRLDAATGGYRNWQGRPEAAIPVAAVWQNPTGMPTRIEGLDARDGRLYVTCASAAVRLGDVTDWRALLNRVVRGEGLDATVRGKLNAHWQKLLPKWGEGPADLDSFCKAPNYYTPGLRENVVQILNDLLRDKALTAGPADRTPARLAENNRRHLDQAFTGLLAPLPASFMAVLDGATGKEQRRIELDLPSAIRAAAADRVYVVTGDGTAVVAVNPQSGQVTPVISGLQGARGIAVAADGQLFASTAEPAHQVRRFTAAGQPAGTIGRDGGRAAIGPWQPDGVRNPAGLVVAADGRLWVTEATQSPKRVSIWDATSGKLLREFFGPTHYGASGGAIHPADPNLMVGEGCEWRLDAATGRASCLGVFDNAIHGWARYGRGANGRTYVVTASDRGTTAQIFERLGDGDFRRRATVDADAFWSDVNGDGAQQPAEVSATVTNGIGFGGYLGWSAGFNADLSFTAFTKKPSAGLLVPVAGFTPCGAPRYDLAQAVSLPGVSGVSHRAAKGPRLLAYLEPTRGQTLVACYDSQDATPLWTYPNPFSGVHGSHAAPPPEPGLLRGVFGVVGSAHLPAPLGNVWAFNSNVGEWHMLTEDGFYLTRLFEGDAFKQHFPEQAVPGAILDACPPGLGGEDFGGSMVQGDDGKVYLQAGKTALWNVEVVGLDQVRALAGGKVRLEPADLETAQRMREEQLQGVAGGKVATIRQATVTPSGRLEQDFKGEKLAFRKLDNAAVRVAAAWDAENLYLGWEVGDDTPWVNGADAPEFLYARGDTVDFQLGTDPAANKNRAEPVAGDLRLSIGSFKGQPTAVMYRKVAAVKEPKVFSSGVVKEYTLDYVAVVPGVRCNVQVDARARKYTVEAAVPLAALGLKPEAGLGLRGDFGVTHGDTTGSDTALRTYWNNQQTGLVNDEVFELRMEPKNWGTLVFQQ